MPVLVTEVQETQETMHTDFKSLQQKILDLESKLQMKPIEEPPGVKFDLCAFNSLTTDPTKFNESTAKKLPLVQIDEIKPIKKLWPKHSTPT